LKTAKELLNQREMLFNKNQYLVDININKVADIFAGENMLEQLEEYIEASWANTYGNLERFEYNQGFLRWTFGYNGLDSKTSVALSKNGQTIAIVLHSPRTLIYQGQETRCGIHTCLSVHPENTAHGLAKYLIVALEQACMEEEYDGIYFWFHSSLPKPVTCFRIYNSFDGALMENWGDYNLKIRILNPERVAAFTHLKAYEIGIAHLISRPRPVKSLRDYEEISDNNWEDALHFLNNFARNRGEGRLFAPDEFKQYAMFDDNNSEFAVLGLVKRVRGEIKAVMIGYYIYMSGKDRDSIFFIDLLCVDKQVEFNEFLKCIELLIIKRFNPSCLMCMDQRLGLAQRYLPSGTILACRSIAFKPTLVKSDKKKRIVPIIDMK